MGTFTKPQARRHLTLWQLAVWAFRDQFAWRDAGLWSGSPVRGSTDGCGGIEELGVVVNGGEHKGLGRGAHPDAIAIAVRTPVIVAEHARIADIPDWPQDPPRPFPTLADRRRDAKWCRGIYGGRLIDIRVEDYRERMRVPEVHVRLRKRRVRRVETARLVWQMVTVEFCPISWKPDASWVEFRQQVRQDWEDGMRDLWQAMQAIPLKEHVLTGIGAGLTESVSDQIVVDN